LSSCSSSPCSSKKRVSWADEYYIMQDPKPRTQAQRMVEREHPLSVRLEGFEAAKRTALAHVDRARKATEDTALSEYFSALHARLEEILEEARLEEAQRVLYLQARQASLQNFENSRHASIATPPELQERQALDARLEEIEANLRALQHQRSKPAPLDEERVQSLIAADLDLYNEHVTALMHAHAEKGQQQAAQQRPAGEPEMWEARGEVCLTYLAHLEHKVASLTAMLKDKDAFEAQVLEMKADARQRNEELRDELRAAKLEIEDQRRCLRQVDDKVRALELALEQERYQHMLSKTLASKQGEVDRVELQYLCNSHESLERQIDTLQAKVASEVEERVRAQVLLTQLERSNGQADVWRQAGAFLGEESEVEGLRWREEAQDGERVLQSYSEVAALFQFKREVAVLGRQMLTLLSSMQLDVDALHAVLAVHVHAIEQVLSISRDPPCFCSCLFLPATPHPPSDVSNTHRFPWCFLRLLMSEKMWAAAGIWQQISVAVAERKVWRLPRRTETAPDRAFEWYQAEF